MTDTIKAAIEAKCTKEGWTLSTVSPKIKEGDKNAKVYFWVDLGPHPIVKGERVTQQKWISV